MIRSFLGPVLHRQAPRVLAGVFDAPAIDAIEARTWSRYEELRRTLPVARNAGGRLNLHLAALTVALFDAIVEAGAQPGRAAEAVRDLAWIVYRVAGRVVWAWARLRSRDPVRRLRVATDAFRRFPFGPPSYAWSDLAAAPSVVAFDNARCVVADWMRSQGAGALCAATWCALDDRLAPLWGATLESPRPTIASGSERCEFRWRTGLGARGPDASRCAS